MALIDLKYKAVLEQILNWGFLYTDKTRDIKMLQVPTMTMEINPTGEFPLLTTKRVYWPAIVHEFIWMMSGSTSIQYLHDNNISIWDKDVNRFNVPEYTRRNELLQATYAGRVYGPQWRNWTMHDCTAHDNGLDPGLDQIRALIANLHDGSLYTRRNIVTAWNPAELDDMCLPPCHWAFEIIPYHGLDGVKGFALKWHQRSVDAFLGLPFDIASYSLMGFLIEDLTGIKFRKLYADLSNIHLYEPHIPLAKKQLTRSVDIPGPEFKLTGHYSINKLDFNNFNLIGYNPLRAIHAQMYAPK